MMKPKSGLLFQLAILLAFMTIHIVEAQQPSQDLSRNDPSDKSKYVAVVGAVRIQSRFDLRRPVRLLEAIQLAGGVTEETGSSVHVVHTIPPPVGCDVSIDDYNLTAVLRGDEKANSYLRPGDIVSVSDADKVYVIGNVLKPIAVLFKESLTVSQAIILTGGHLRDTKTDKIRVYRHGAGTVRTEFTVDLKAIREGRAEDLVLQPNDIVNVPHKRGNHGRSFCPFQMVVSKQPPLRIIQ